MGVFAKDLAPAVGKVYKGYSASGGDGPGAYNPNVNAIYPAPPKWSMGKEKRMNLDKERLQCPGPQDYHPGDIKGQNAPQYSIPMARRPKSSTDVPSPLHYYPEKSKFKDIKYTVPQASRESKIDPENGPAKYSPNFDSVLPVPPSKSVGRADRFEADLEEDFHVGPGAYDINDDWEKTAPRYSFGKDERRNVVPNSENPGPAEYTVVDEFDDNVVKQRGWTLSGKLLPEKNSIDITPAPSQYNPKVPQDKTLGGTIPKAEKHPDNKESCAVPAPNLYQPYVDLVTEHHPHYSFGTGKRTSPSKDKGGNPTIYDVRKSTGSILDITRRGTSLPHASKAAWFQHGNHGHSWARCLQTYYIHDA